MGQKSQQDALFFRFLTKKTLLSCPYFVKNVHSLKTNSSLLSIFCPKNVHSLKNKVLSCHFFHFLHKNPILLCRYLVKKRIFCQNYTIFWAIKVNTQVFFQPFLYLDFVRFLRDFQKVFVWGLSVSGVFYHFFLKYSCEVYLL